MHWWGSRCIRLWRPGWTRWASHTTAPLDRSRIGFTDSSDPVSPTYWTFDPGTPNLANLAPGTYTYFCRIHPFMRGAFRVVKSKSSKRA